MNKAKFVVKPTTSCRLRGSRAADQWYFVIVASNGKVIATSEIYSRRNSCMEGIKAVRNAVPEALVEIDTGKDDG